MGHILKYVARRPVVVDNFINDVGGDGNQFLMETLTSREDVAAQRLAERNVRYVVASAAMESDEFSPGSAFDALMNMGVPTAAPRAEPAPALTRFRLIMEWMMRSQAGQPSLPLYRVYERVVGARLVGRALPFSEVSASLILIVNRNRNRKLPYLATTRADASGNWMLRVLYSTVGAPPSVATEAGYSVLCNDRAIQIAVTEQAVQEGMKIRVPCQRRAESGLPRR